jgi:DUF2975 family protein
MLRVAQAVLVALAVYAALGAASVVLGSNGTRTIYDRHVPRVVGTTVQKLWPQAGQGPAAPVLVEPAHRDDPLFEFNASYPDEGSAPPHWAELNGGFGEHAGGAGLLTFWDPSRATELGFLLLGVLPWLALAWLWWSLAKVAGSARTGDPFVSGTARFLALAGGLLFLGPALLLLARLGVLAWMLEESTASGKAHVWFQWAMVPVWPTGIGLALLVLAVVWRRGVRMRDDLEGLV